MKSAKLLVALAATGLVATSAFAQKSAFEGFYGQLATGYENNTLKNNGGILSGVDSNGSGDTWSNPLTTGGTQTAGGVPLVAGLGYNFAINNQFLVGLGVDYSFLSQKTNNYSSSIVDADGTVTTFGGQQVKISNRLNIFITPGYAIDKDKLVYVKAGYSQQTMNYTGANTIDGFPISAAGIASFSSQNQTMTGYILGLGYRQVISGGVYAFAEGNYMSYGQKSFTSSSVTSDGRPLNVSLSPSANAYNLLVGVGYKF